MQKSLIIIIESPKIINKMEIKIRNYVKTKKLKNIIIRQIKENNGKSEQ